MTVELLRRLETIVGTLSRSRLDGLIVGPTNDFRYLTGVQPRPSERLTALVVTAEGDATLLAPEIEHEKYADVPERFARLFWAESEDPISLVGRILGEARRVAVDRGLDAGSLLTLMAALGEEVQVIADDAVASARALKSPLELELLQASAAVADRALGKAFAGLARGMPEIELSSSIDVVFVDAGARRSELFALVASGENAAFPHHYPTHRGVDGCLLLDIGARIDGYWSDTSRTAVVGPASPQLRSIHAVVEEAQAAAVDAVRAGHLTGEVDAVARGVIARAGFGEYFTHRTGHGIGLEPHEAPFLIEGGRVPLQPGHVVTVEPGIYLPGVGGVRIEDVVIVTPTEPRVINNTSRDLTLL